MIKNLALIGAALFFIACSSNDKKLAEGQLPLEAFFKNPVAGNVIISPNGETLAALKPYENRMNVFIKPINGTEWEMVSKITDRDIRQIWWKGDDTILFTKDFGGDENFHLFSIDLKTKKSLDLTNYPSTRVSILDDLKDISPTDVLVEMNKRDAKVFDVYRLNILTGKTEMVLQNPGNYTGFLTDHKGEIRVTMSTDGVNNTLYYRDSGKKDFRKVITLNFKQSLQPIVFDKNNKYVYGLSNLNNNTSRVVQINPKTGKIIKTIYTNKNYDITSLNFSEKTKELTGAGFIDWKFQYHFFDKNYAKRYEAIKKQIPNREIYLVSTNKNEDTFIVKATGDRTMGQYYLYADKAPTVTMLLDASPWLKEEMLSEMKPITYKSRDGLTINGYLTLPKNSGGKNLPIVINPHGGPWARDLWRYDSEVQFLANRGYGVLQMNFRGSTGYGRKFWEASFKQCGLTMQNDVTDGVNWLVSQGIADKDRVCIYGGSYGGYATLAGLAFTPDVYKCGVDYVGVSNIFTLLETIPPYWTPYLAMFHEMIGDPKTEKVLLEKASPLFSADKITAPLLVVQGAKDPRVKKSESDQIVAALKKRGVEVPYLVKENEGHGFHNEENRFEFYRTMEAFLDKHLKNEAI